MNVVDRINPFCLEPVRSAEQFFGRTKEIRQALSLLDKGQNVSVEGPDKIGKTSFLEHVADAGTRAAYGLAQDRVFVHLDSRSLADLDPDQYYLLATNEIVRQIQEARPLDAAVRARLEGAANEVDPERPFYGLRRVCEVAQDSGIMLVLVLDDCGYLAERFADSMPFFPSLRSLSSTYQVAYLTASQQPLYQLEQTMPQASPFFNTFHRLPLGPLAADESRELVVTLLEWAGMDLPQSIVEWILEWSAGEPYRLQQAGSIVFELWLERGGYLEAADRAEIRRRLDGER